MSHLALFIRSVSSLFCNHEWMRRTENRRVYLECVHCLATTPGLVVGPEAKPAPRVRRRAFRTAAAA